MTDYVYTKTWQDVARIVSKNRINLGWSFQELSEHAGVSLVDVLKIELEIHVRPHTIRAVMDTLGLVPLFIPLDRETLYQQ